MRFRACEPGCPLDATSGREGDHPDAVGSASCCMEAEVACCPEPAAPTGIRDLPLFHRIAKRLETAEVLASEERRSAEDLYDELMGTRAGLREQAVEQQDRFASFALAERLLQESVEARSERPDASVELASLALRVAERLDPGRFGRGLVADLRARSWAYLGDHWSAHAPPAAREAFRLAHIHLGRGSGDPLEEAEVLALSATALREDRGPDSARAHLDRAGQIYRTAGEPLRAGETLAHKARLAGSEGRHLEAAGLLREAAGLLHDLAPVSELAALGADVAHHLEAAGRVDDAWTEVARVRRLLGAEAAPALRARLAWIEGRVAARMGLEEEARVHLTTGRDGLLAAGRAREAVAAHLDLAALAARADTPARSGAQRRLADETPRLLAGGDLRREEITTLLLVDQAAQKGALGPDLVAALSGFLARLP